MNIALAVAILASSSGCGGGPSALASGSEADARPHPNRTACADVVEPNELERCVGDRFDQMFTTQLGVYEDPALLDYVRSISVRLVEVAGDDPSAWTIRVLDDPGANAWAGPGRHLWVTRGLLVHLASEAELAAVLAHEVAHGVAGHTRVQRGALPDAYFSDWSTRFELDRDDEAQADQLAVVYVRRAGYDERAVQSMLEALHRAAGLGEHSWEDRHPPLSVRVALTARVAAGATGGRREEARYLGHLEGAVVGRDPTQGRVVDSRFVHERGGFSFGLPDGWEHVEWQPGTIQSRWFSASSPDDATAMLVLPVAGPYGNIMGDALEADLREGATVRRRFGDYDAVVGTLGTREDAAITMIGTEGGVRVAVFEARDGFRYGLFVAKKSRAGPAIESVFAQIIGTFHTGERVVDHPHRLRLIHVTRGTTRESLAALGCLAESAEATLEQLNGPALETALAEGGMVKCVEP